MHGLLTAILTGVIIKNLYDVENAYGDKCILQDTNQKLPISVCQQQDICDIEILYNY